jgi:hypothetical protein
MKKFRLTLIGLITVLGIFFNIERFDIGGEPSVNIDSFVYVLGLLAVLAIIAFPTVWRNSFLIPLALGLTVYLIGKLFIFNERPFFGNVYTYITITEISFLSIIIWLSCQLTRSMLSFEYNVKEFTNTLIANKLPDVEKSQRIISTEMTRSRHYERPMSIITIHPKQYAQYQLDQLMLQEIQEKTSKEYTKARVAETLRQAMRRIDTVLDIDQEGSLMVLCPEVDKEQTVTLMEHLQAEIEKDLGIPVVCQTATFPTDGITFSALVEAMGNQKNVDEAITSETSSTQAELTLQG